jgi:hypothetical protein
MQTQQAAAPTTAAKPPMKGRGMHPPTYGGNFMLTPSLLDNVAPDITLPEQYFMNQQSDDGMGAERALMYAVLKDGIRCFYKNVGASRRKYKKVYDEAEEWLGEDCWDDPFSFRVICDTLSIDAGCLRSRLFEWRDTELRRRELTGDTSSAQVGRSPFPSTMDLEGSDSGSYNDRDVEASDEDEWAEAGHVSLDDMESEELVYAAA